MEERVGLLEFQYRQLRAEIHGGDGVEWEQSVRGRLHAVSNAQASAQALAEAARQMRLDRAATERRDKWRIGILVTLVGVIPAWVTIAILLIH